MRRPISVGVDISDSSIKLLQLDTDGSILAYGSGLLPDGVVRDGFIYNKELFAETLKTLLKNTQPTSLSLEHVLLRAVICVPESKLFTHHTKLPKHIKVGDIETYIKEDAQKIIPFNLADLYWDFHLSEKKGERYATFVGAPKYNVDNYVAALTFAEMKPALIVGELSSLAYSLLTSTSTSSAYMIADIGARTTNIGTFYGSTVASFSATVSVGGDKLTNALVESLQVTTQEAEIIKREKGLRESTGDAKAFNILRLQCEEIVEALQQAKTYFETTNGQSISHVILCGGTALMPGLVKYFSKALSVEVSLADPFLNIKNREVIKMDIPEVFFTTVVGLALQSGSDSVPSINLLTQYRYSEDKTKKETLAFRDIQSLSDFMYVMYGYIKSVRSYLKPVKRLSVINLPIKLISSVLFVTATLLFLGWVIISYT